MLISHTAYRAVEGCSFEDLVWGAVNEMCGKRPYDIAKHLAALNAEIDEASGNVAALDAMNDEEILANLRVEYVESRERHGRINALRRDRRASVAVMLQQAETWTPPSTEHHALKQYMLAQLRDASEHPMLQDAEFERSEPTLEDVAAFRSQAVEALERLKKKASEKLALMKRHNAWLSAIEESVPRPGSAEATAARSETTSPAQYQPKEDFAQTLQALLVTDKDSGYQQEIFARLVSCYLDSDGSHWCRVASVLREHGVYAEYVKKIKQRALELESKTGT